MKFVTIPLCMANKSIAIILIPNKYHEFRARCKFICANFTGEVHICSTTKDTEVRYFRFFTCKDLLRRFPLKTFNVSVVINMGSSCKANSHQESGKHASSRIDCAFSSSVRFNRSAQPFCWCTCSVLVSWTIPCSHKKDCNSDVIYSPPLSVCRCLTE